MNRTLIILIFLFNLLSCFFSPQSVLAATSGSSSATSYSFQRKTWYDGSRYWQAFNANSQIEFWYSTDGSSWTENTNARISVNTSDFSIEADSSNVFIAYTNGYDIETRSGSSYPGTGFSWSSAATACNGSSSSDTFSYPTLSRDSNNKIWLNSRHFYEKTFSSNNPTVDGYVSKNDMSAYSLNTSATSFNIGLRESGMDYYDRGFVEWDISSIPDTATITNTTFKYNGYSHGTDARVYPMTSRPSTASNSTLWTDAGNGTTLASVSGFPVVGAGKTIGLGATGNSDVASKLSGDWFAIGLKSTNETSGTLSKIYSEEYASANPAPTLEVRYTLYYFESIQSSSANDITSWTSPFVLDYSANSNYYGLNTSVGVGSSANMYSVWIDGTAIEGKFYSGAGTTGWASSADSIGTGVTGLANSLSLLSDSSGNAHLAFIGVGGSAVYQERTSSWQSAVILDNNSGNKYPSISLDTAGSNGLYLFWTRSDDIFYKRACSDYTTWGSIQTLESNDTNNWLTTGYKDFGSGKIFALWTKGSGSPYTISWNSFSPTSCVSNAAPSAPQSPYANNSTAQTGQTTPVTGLTDHTPAFSAIYDDTNTSDTSSYYQIQVGSDSDWTSAEMWDSTKTSQTSCNENSRCSDIIYNGSTLQDGQTYYWRIKFWDNSDAEGSWSATQQFSMNQLPQVSNIVLNGNNNIALIENSSVGISWSSTVSDADGYANISTVAGKVYRSGVGSSCSSNNNNCYSVSSCSTSNCSGNSCTATCTANLLFHAEATSTGTTFASQFWQAQVTATDLNSETGTTVSSSTAVDILTLSAFDIGTTLFYGSLIPGDNTSNKITVVTNTGNQTINLELYGDDLCSTYPSCSGPKILVTNQQYSLNTFTYGSGETLTVSPVTVEVGLSKPNTSPSDSSKNIYWGIGIPVQKETGSYSSTITILAAP